MTYSEQLGDVVERVARRCDEKVRIQKRKVQVGYARCEVMIVDEKR